MKFAIPHSSWHPERGRTLKRLVASLAEQSAEIHVSVSARKEHSAIWATRLWEYAAGEHDHVVCLNDDVILHPEFVAICKAMVEAVPDEIISLHTQAPGANNVDAPWARCYWLTGPAYILPPGYARKLLDWPAPWSFLSRVNEDNRAIHWAWEEQRPFFQAIPAPVIHDVETKSTLGYDGHPHRLPSVPWQNYPAAPLTDPAYWRVASPPPFLENPWMSTGFLDYARRLFRSGRVMCVICLSRESVIGNRDGVAICNQCLHTSWTAVTQPRTP